MATTVESVARADGVMAAAKKKRKKRAPKATASEAAPPPLQPGPNDQLMSGPVVDVLLRPLTPAPTYRTGQSVFFEVVIGRRKTGKSRQVRLELAGTGLDVAVTAPKGVTTKAVDTLTVLDVPLGRTTQKLMLEVQITTSVPTGPSHGARLDVRLREKKGAPPLAESSVSFPVADCATGYHQALSGLFSAKQPIFDDLLKSVSKADEALSGSWLFSPRKLSKQELAPLQFVRLPPRAQCLWSVATVDFSTRQSKRVCKKWEIVEIGPSPALEVPRVDEREAAALLKRAGGLVGSRGSIAAFGKQGRLEWVSRRILTDLKVYMRQSPHPALCTGVEVMTGYFVENAAALRKEIAASAQAAQRAREIATVRLDALAAVLGEQPQEPTETASLSLITPANAAVSDAATDQLVERAGRLLLDQSLQPQLQATVGALPKLARLKELLGEQSPLAASGVHAPDALTALEGLVYLEAAQDRYQRVGAAVFGSISEIEAAHARSCDCSP